MTEEDYDVHRIMSFFFFAGWGSLPFLLLFFAGFAWVGILSVKDWARAR